MTSFKISGAALAGIVDVVKSMSLADSNDFNLVAQGERLSVTCLNPACVAIIEASFLIAGGPHEPLEVCLNLRLYKKTVAPFKGVAEVVASMEGASLVLRSGRRKVSMGTVAKGLAPSGKVPSLDFDASVSVPVEFLAECAANSESESVELTLGDGSLTWKAEHETGSYEDSCEGATEGSATGFFTPSLIGEVMGALKSGPCLIRMKSGLPMMFEMETKFGATRAVMAQRA